MSGKETEMEMQARSETKSIVLVGVGGQGILLASEIPWPGQPCWKALRSRPMRCTAWPRGAASVVAQVRYGPVVHSPLVARGKAQVLGALEQIEALRFAEYLRPDGAGGGQCPGHCAGERLLRRGQISR